MALRVSIHHSASAFLLKLEGPFTAAEAPEVEARWRTAASLPGNRVFLVDLTAVTFAEPAARGLLDRMRGAGVGLVVDAPQAAWLASGITFPEPSRHVERKRGFRRTLEGFPALVACLFTRVRTSAG
jgi:hypothetical protein